MQVRILPAARGLAWFREGIAIYRRNPFGLTGNVMLMFLCLIVTLMFGQLLEQLVAGVLPDSVASGIGQLPFVLALPPLSVGVFSAFRAVERGQPVMPGYLFANIGRNLLPLCVLGALYFAATLVALGLISLTDGGLLYDVMRDMRRLEDKQLDVQMLNRSALLLLPLSLALTAANWFAPLLTGWRGLHPVKSAFFSIVACWRNWRAFLVFGLASLAFAWLLALVIGVLAMMVPTLGMVLAAALPLFVLPLLYGAFYANAHDVLPELFDGDA
jgi:hypothetical protein